MKAPHLKRTWWRLSSIAPIVALGMLLVPAIWSHRTASPEAVKARNASIADAVSAFPYRLDGWIGQDVPVPAAAQDILQPNAMLSRRYERLGGSGGATLVVIHCADARQMVGHAPPVCYPNAGWSEVAEQSEPVRIEPWPGLACTMHRFVFRLLQRGGTERVVHVYVAFVLPDGTVADDLVAVRDRAGSSVRSAEGVAQVQIVVESPRSIDESLQTARDLVAAAAPLLRALGVGGHPASPDVERKRAEPPGSVGATPEGGSHV